MARELAPLTLNALGLLRLLFVRKKTFVCLRHLRDRHRRDKGQSRARRFGRHEMGKNRKLEPSQKGIKRS